MDLGNKSLGNPGDVPAVCYRCAQPMSVRGWLKAGWRVTCLACHQTFNINETITED